MRSSRLLIPADVIASASYYLAFVRLEPDVMAASMEQPKLATRTVPCAPTFQYPEHLVLEPGTHVVHFRGIGATLPAPAACIK